MSFLRYSIFAFFCLLPFSPALRAQEVLDGVAAVVNEDVITFSQVRELTGELERAARANLTGNALVSKVKEIRISAVNQLIERQLILQEFRKMKGSMPQYAVDEQVTNMIREQFGGDRAAFLRTLAAQGWTLDRFRKSEEEKLIVRAMRSREAKSDLLIPESKINEFYREHSQEWTTNAEAKLRMILIRQGSEPEKKRKMIMEIRDKIARGADFGDLARIYSEDSTQDNGGDWGWVKQGDLSEGLSRAVFAQKTGKLSEVIEMNQSYYLILVEARRGGVTKPLREVRQQIENYLQQTERQKQQQAWVDRLRRKAYVKIY